MSANGPFVSVLIARNTDKLHLCAFTDSNFNSGQGGQHGHGNFKVQQQRILQRMVVPDGGGYVSFDHKDLVYYAFVDQATNLTILAIASKLLWSQSMQQLETLACSLLDAIFSEFINFCTAEEIAAASRPFHFIKFDNMMQKTLKRIAGGGKAGTKTITTAGGTTSGAGDQYDLLKREIRDVHTVIKNNLEDILSRGEKLETMTSHASQLKEHSSKYKERTVRLNRMKFLKTYGPPAAILLFIILWLLWKFVL